MTAVTTTADVRDKPHEFLLLHSPQGHRLYVRGANVDIVAEALADDAQTGAGATLVVNGTTAVVAEDLDTILAMLE